MDGITLVERITSEGTLGMRAAAALAGQKSASTLVRWHKRGVRRDGSIIKLEAIRTGAKRLTSRAAVLRFLAALNEPATVPPSGSIIEQPATRRKRAGKASAKLDALLAAA